MCLTKAPLDARELRRRQLTGQAQFFPNTEAALATALEQAGLADDNIGYDSLAAQSALGKAAPALRLRLAKDLAKHIRLIKTAAELSLMRAAARANAEAGLPAGRAARGAATLLRLRRLFFRRLRSAATHRSSCWWMTRWMRHTTNRCRRGAAF